MGPVFFRLLLLACADEQLVHQPRTPQLQDQLAQARGFDGDRRLAALRQVVGRFVQPVIESVPVSHARWSFPVAFPAYIRRGATATVKIR